MQDKIRKLKKSKSQIFLEVAFAISLIGGLGLCACIVLSEAVYPEIEELALCPKWYQVALYASVAVSVIGIILSAFARNKSNTKEREFEIEFAIIAIGVICAGFAFSEQEAYWIDVLSVAGIGIVSVGVVLAIGSGIGLSKKPKGIYAGALKKADAKAYKEAVHRGPAKLNAIIKTETDLDTVFTNELISYYREFNGDGDLMFSVEETSNTNYIVRSLLYECCPMVENLVFFGGNGCGDYFCFKSEEYLSPARNVIYLWRHETLTLTPVARSIEELIRKYYGGEIE